MQVLSLTNEFAGERFGGAGTAVTGMLQTLARHGIIQVVVVPASHRDTPFWENTCSNLNTLWLPRDNSYFGRLGLVNSAAVLAEFPELRQQWDIIHVHAINFAPLAYILADGRIPILYSVYSLLRDELEDRGEPDLLAQFAIQDDLLCRSRRIHLVSQHQKHRLSARSPDLLSKSIVLPLGIPELGSWNHGNSHTFIYVGRLLPYKGIEDVLKALLFLKRSGRSVQLLVLGKGTDDYELYLREWVRKYQLEVCVNWQGWQAPNAVQGWVQQAGTLIVPSQREAFGLVALEGMAAGIPLIVSSAGALPELVDSSCAKTYAPGNVQQLAEAMAWSLDHRQNMCLLGTRAQNKAKEYLWARLAGQYAALYKAAAL